MTKITTPEATLSYENLFEPSAPDGSFAEPQYSACLVFDKEANLSELGKVVEDARKLKCVKVSVSIRRARGSLMRF